jgi:hypothetical protein
MPDESLLASRNNMTIFLLFVTRWQGYIARRFHPIALTIAIGIFS